MLQPFGHNPQYVKRTENGETGKECCLCGRQTDMTRMVPINHERCEFVMEWVEDEVKVSLYPIGPECIKKWRREYGAQKS